MTVGTEVNKLFFKSISCKFAKEREAGPLRLLPSVIY